MLILTTYFLGFSGLIFALRMNMKVDVNILDIAMTTPPHIHTDTMTLMMAYFHVFIWLHVTWEKPVKGKIATEQTRWAFVTTSD